MQKFAQEMAALIHKIHCAASARHESLQETRSAMRSMRQQDRRQRRGLADALARQAKGLEMNLAGQHRQRQREAQTFHQQMSQMGAARQATRATAHAQTSMRLAGFDQQRFQNRQCLTTARRQAMAELRQTVARMRSAAQARRQATSADIREAERLWKNGLAS